MASSDKEGWLYCPIRYWPFATPLLCWRPVLDEGGHDVLLRRLNRLVRGREMSARVDGRILRGEIVEQRHPVVLPLRRTGTGDRAAKILFRQALIAVARILPRQAMPVIVAALHRELLRALRIVVISRSRCHGSRCHHHERRSHHQHPHLVLLFAQ